MFGSPSLLAAGSSSAGDLIFLRSVFILRGPLIRSRGQTRSIEDGDPWGFACSSPCTPITEAQEPALSSQGSHAVGGMPRSHAADDIGAKEVIWRGT